MHTAPRPPSPSAAPQLDAVIVGAGFSGLYQLYRLRELGLRTRVLEACDDIGGTWYRNRYPGARCDVESTAYSFSFSPELDQEWEWSERYATRPELLRYLHHVADRFDLRKDITLRTRVTGAVYDEDGHTWQVTTDTGETITTRFVVLATGCMSAVKEPDIPGAGTFAGRALHTADWPHEDVDLTGRRVAVIGTGCSGIQAIPLLAEQAAELTVFQRTPVYALPARNRPLSAAETTELKARYPEFRAAQRRSKGGTLFEPPTRSALEVDEAERRATYEEGWDSGVLSGLLRTYTDILVDRAANETVAEFVRSKIRSIVTDPETAETLSPRTFPFGTKRPCLDTGYYATYNKPHVRVVDLTKTPIVEITPRGIRTSDREHAVDVIAFATGFDALTGSQVAMDIVGKGGITLREKWADGPRNHLGLLSAGFPNLFTVIGPLSPSVLSNAVVAIEQHVEWITDCIAHLRRRGITEIDATPRAEVDWCTHVADLAAQTLYPSVDSWYMGANVPGKPRVFLAYTGGLERYRAECAAAADDGYRAFALSGGAA
ncbi:NAD(P)/FAD-dependent oxidoreductase [Streptomyces sp. Je 1-4]|uniref:flavin-containing monooxygenase n=1 Tax=Streptomyces TaxID=1883 RepID=UPI0021DB2337|nr:MULTISPECIES: NAD(P)/FAD-dependent oxidoreductase [unclassified Streptomyces]UYB38192.1 NAD(P)/FAD-dependent oxidoreductase [Streptomyces sp. Je 1-4]UZQ34133.1 NAD(P)/FAD-dependent oxidoreductase [Streptomyces sp. Je 1-4] [Streptomyces sp. Je 1-4 4N24]UZQ41551.1 NAD(P)/FAD-dependent oxidoreductase [Streptomyces sp. Je 1-4] [Streptomyces sp. Je 1-4 4N24_ara]